MDWLLDSAIKVESPADIARQILAARGFERPQIDEFFQLDYERLIALSEGLPDLDLAADRIAQAIEFRHKIVVYGDYDIDGITATALMFQALHDAGADVSIYIPDRFEEGYGLNSSALEFLVSNGAQLVITVDCGITSVEEIAQAAKLGLDIIVTDHHGLAEQLPERAVALINPKRVPDSPLYEIAGVGVAYLLVVGLQQRGIIGLAAGREKWLLDLVALGTICDVVPLVGANRLLAHYGLIVMRQTRRCGLRALAEVSGVDLKQVRASEVAFRFGPRLNAAGRLEHARQALDLLLVEDDVEAKALADKLQQLNADRQLLTEATYNEAVELLKDKDDDRVVVLANENWSHGIIGIVASRVVERTGKPTILLQIKDGVAKGSARSPKGFSIIEAITRQSQYLDRFGGHAYAAGMTLAQDKLADFVAALNADELTRQFAPTRRQLVIDGIVAPKLIDTDTYEAMQLLAPFGQANSEPIFMSSLRVISFRPVGTDLSHLQVKFSAPSGVVSAIAFRKAGNWPWLRENILVDVVYTLDKNEWQGVVRVQLLIHDMRAHDDGTGIQESDTTI